MSWRVTVGGVTGGAAGGVFTRVAGQACFTAGTQVLLADGRAKAIEDVVVGDEVVASGPTTDGAVSLTVAGLTPGTTSVVARFTPASPGSPAVLSAPADVRVTKAVSELDLDATKAAGKRARLVLDLAVPAVPTRGRVVLRDNGALLRVELPG